MTARRVAVALVALGAAAAVAAAVVERRGAEREDALLVGFSEDLPKEEGAAATNLAVALGANAMRITLQWPAGATAVDPAAVANLERATGSSGDVRWILSVYGVLPGGSPPLDAPAREAYCSFVRDALTQVPAIRDVVIWNEPNSGLFWSPVAGSPAAYAELLARCHAVLHEAFDDVNVVGLALAPNGWDNDRSHSPGAFLRALGDAYRASGRTAPLFDTVAFHPYLRHPREPVATRHEGKKEIALGDHGKLLANLRAAFEGTGQPLPGEAGVELWYLELGFQTGVAAGHEHAYSGSETAVTLSEAEQADRVLASFRLAACQPHVGAILNFMLVDEPRLEGWQSGPLRADRTRKASYDAFVQALEEARDGEVVCG